MSLLLMLLLLIYGCFLPVTLQMDVRHHADTQMRIIVRLAGFTKAWHIRGLSGTATRLREGRSLMLLSLLRRADKARTLLLHHLHLERLDALILLRTEDAAHSAVLSGAARCLLSCIPMLRRKAVRIRVLPEFFRTHSTVSARCIIRTRLGTIILTAGMLLAAHLHGQHLTESEAM